MIEGIEVTWLGHASVKAKAADKVVYFDPWKLSAKKSEPADLILITHSHGDHCSPEDVKKITKSTTEIVTVADCAGKLSGRVTTLKAGQKATVGGLPVQAVPAYNVSKPFHPRENGWVGFVVELAGKRIYHSGDTDLIPEMHQIQCDVAFLPCGGKYTMTAEEAARAAAAIRPKVAIPMHFGDIIGSGQDAERFGALCQCSVQILAPVR